MSRANQVEFVATVLRHYIQSTWTKCGIQWSQENTDEITQLADHIVPQEKQERAQSEETRPEASRRILAERRKKLDELITALQEKPRLTHLQEIDKIKREVEIAAIDFFILTGLYPSKEL